MGLEVKHLTRAIAQSVLSGLLSICSVMPSLAGGFTQPKDFTFTSLSFFTFDTDDFYKNEIQLYLEHGIEDNISLIFKSPYAWVENRGDYDEGFSEQELGLRWRFNQDPYLAAAIQGLLITPGSYNATGDDNSDERVVGVELSIPVSRGFQLDNERSGYGTIEVGYRDYFGAVSDEVRLTGELSVDLVKRLAIATQFYGIFRLQDNFQQIRDDFSKVGGQLRWGADENLTLVVGGFKNINEEGGSFEAQIWYRFGPRRQQQPTPPLEPATPSTTPSQR